MSHFVPNPVEPAPAECSEGAVVRRLPLAGNEGTLVGRLKDRSPGAWAEVFDLHGARLRALLFRTLGYDSESADVLQEVMLGAWRGIDAYRGDERGLGAWLATITVNTARGTLRRRKVRSFVRLFSPSELPDTTFTVVSEEARDTLRRIYSLLERLPVDDRMVVTLCLMDQMPQFEVAEHLGVNVRTVKRRLASGRARFARLAQRDPELVDLLQHWEQTHD